MIENEQIEIDSFTTIEQCNNKIKGFKNLLEQKDYRGRKVAVELANVLIAKNILTLNDLPVFAEYLADEAKADEFREVINYAEAKKEGIK